MATKIQLKNPNTGIITDGYIGYSWTTLVFGIFPALFRGDFMTFIFGFVIACIVASLTAGLGGFVLGIIWSFIYNSYHLKKLIASGYKVINPSPETRTSLAAAGFDVNIVTL